LVQRLILVLARKITWKFPSYPRVTPAEITLHDTGLSVRFDVMLNEAQRSEESLQASIQQIVSGILRFHWSLRMTAGRLENQVRQRAC
jgi:hypothetical protein